jgi:glycosyltransferase involved in cell wall biosynthesis
MPISNENEAPLLTILIPTRNRPHTAMGSIRNVLNLPSERIELVVQDCSDDDSLGKRLAEEVNDSRMHYFYAAESLSMTENWNRGVARARGEFVTIIGDDDGVSEEIVAVAEWAKSEGLDAVSTVTCAAKYCWPDYGDATRAASLCITRFTGDVSFPDIEAEVTASAHGFGQKLHRLPKIYYGMVRRQCLEKLKQSSGVYFDGVCPDYYAGYALCATVKRYALTDFPFVINGASHRSNAGATGQRDRRNRLKRHMESYTDLFWPDYLPPFFIEASMISQSMLAAFRRTGRDDLSKHFDLPNCYASCWMQDIGQSLPLTRHYFKAISLFGASYVTATLRFVVGILARAGKRLITPLDTWRRRQTESHIIRGLKSVDLAANALGEYNRAHQTPLLAAMRRGS